VILTLQVCSEKLLRFLEFKRVRPKMDKCIKEIMGCSAAAKRSRPAQMGAANRLPNEYLCRAKLA